MNNKVMTVDDIILLEDLVDRYGINTVVNEMKLSKKDIAALIGAGILTAGVYSDDYLSHHFGLDNVDDEYNEYDDTYHKKRKQIETNRFGVPDEIYQEILVKADALKSEINRVMKIQGKTINDIQFDPELMVYLCYENDFDLPLMIAQARSESGFGMGNIARKCNSLFSVGAYDWDPDATKFDSMDSSMIHYINAMKKNYLTKGKTVDDLLKPGGFVNKEGKRYAQNPNYEREVRNIRNQIIKDYPELAEPFSL